MQNIPASLNYLDEAPKLDRAVVGGLALASTLVLAGIIISGRGDNFIDFPSLLIVLGGTLGATLVQFPLYDLRRAWLGFKGILIQRQYHPHERIQYLVRLAHLVRSQGLLVLEREAKQCDDSFLRLAFEITVDGQPHDDVKRILDTETRTSFDRSARAIQVFQTMGAYAPAFGLIGTLIGLIQMLGSLNNPATVGPAMSMALVTTLYGAIMANLVFLPIAGKLRNRVEEEGLVKAITVEGVLALGKQENPIVIEQKLQSFLPLPASR
ncbi:MAG: MotA/TolQ/ExbB proton channel family protein [Deltaproteobacteria bacterium]|nr:MotA/TolQ/ExbB proton channel family protein [Deltaproteobacteria bacterium]